MKANWGRSNKDYSKKGNSKQTNVKGDPPPGVSREKFLQRCAERRRRDIAFWESLGFSRRYLEDEMEKLKVGASFGNIARRER